jgi:hypothetical protein
VAYSKHYPDIYMKGPRETTETLSEVSQCLGQIRIDHRPSTNVERYRYAHPIRRYT